MSHQPLACILPPALLHKIARSASAKNRAALLQTLELDQSFRLRRAERAARQVLRPLGNMAAAPGGTPKRSIYDQKHSEDLTPGTLARKEGQGPVPDASVNQAYDASAIRTSCSGRSSTATPSTTRGCRSKAWSTSGPPTRTPSGTARATCSSVTAMACTSPTPPRALT